jgi:hypothetical protein
MLSRSFLFLMCLAGSSATSAAIVSYDYTGILIGDDATVSGSFGYDNSVADSLPDEDGEGLYDGAGFWSGTVVGGPQDGATFNFTDLSISVTNDDEDFGDSFGGFFPVATGSMSSFDLEDSSASVFSGDSLPTALSLDDFDWFEFTLGAEIGDTTSAQIYEFESISEPTVVPLPTAVWLFGSALLGFVSWTRGQKRVS